MCTMRDFLDLAALVNILDKKAPFYFQHCALRLPTLFDQNRTATVNQSKLSVKRKGRHFTQKEFCGCAERSAKYQVISGTDGVMHLTMPMIYGRNKRW